MTVTSLELEGLVLDSLDWDFVGDSSDDVLPTRKEGKEKQPLVLAFQRLYVWIIRIGNVLKLEVDRVGYCHRGVLWLENILEEGGAHVKTLQDMEWPQIYCFCCLQ